MRLGAALALIFLASSAASGDDASAKLAALPGFRATLEARDLVGGRSFGATLAYRAPDRALATISKDEFVWVGDGRLVVRESGELHTTDIAGWLRETEAALAPALKDVDAIAPGAEPPDLAKLAGRLGLSLDLEMRRRDDRVSIALLLAHRYDAAADRAPGFGFTASEGAAVTTAPTTGFPEKVELLGPTGRVEGEVRVSAFETLAQVPDALLALPEGVDVAKAQVVDPSPRLKERVARDVLSSVLGRLRAAGAASPGFFDRESPRVRAALAGVYAALFRAAYGEKRLRDEARRAVDAEAGTVRGALSEAGEARRDAAVKGLRDRFEANCRRQLRDALAELVRIAESALGPGGTAKEDEAARRRLLAISATAANDAFEKTIVGPMAAEATEEIGRLTASGAPKKQENSRP